MQVPPLLVIMEIETFELRIEPVNGVLWPYCKKCQRFVSLDGEDGEYVEVVKVTQSERTTKIVSGTVVPVLMKWSGSCHGESFGLGNSDKI